MDPKKKKDRVYWVLALRIVSDFGVNLALPVVVLVWFGKWLDARWGTKPLMIIIAFILAFVISTVSIYGKAKKYAQEYKNIEK